MNLTLCMDYVGIIQSNIDNKITYPKLTHKEVTLQSLGIASLLKLDNKLYVLTCHHCINNTSNYELIIGKNKYKCSVAFISEELELALLNFEYDIKSNFLSVDDFECDIILIDKELKINTLNLTKYVEKNKFSKFELKCSFIETKLETVESINMPKMPFITLHLKDKFDDDFIIDGISGSLVSGKNNKIIGIVTSINNSTIQIIPSVIICRFLKEIKDTGEFNGLCTIVGKFSVCNFETDLRQQRNGIYVENTYNMNYNNYNYKNLEKGANLKNSDIIIEINNKQVNKNGYIYDDKMKSDIHLTSYIALNYTCGTLIPLKIMRLTKLNNNDYKEKKILIKARPLQSMKYIKTIFSGKTFTYNGLVFGEISEDIINNYIKVGIYIGLSLQDYYLVNPYRNDDERVVVLLDINRKLLSDQLIKVIDKLQLPLINTVNKNYSVPIVSRINKKKIVSLDDMVSILGKQLNSTIHLTIHKSNEIKGIVKNGLLMDIQ